VELETSRDHRYRYDGDDENGEIQAALDSGEMVAFDSTVSVYLKIDGELLGQDNLGGSVYYADRIAEFWTAHRDSDPANRNCSANEYRVGHYFPDMVRAAIREARDEIRSRLAAAAELPRIRESA